MKNQLKGKMKILTLIAAAVLSVSVLTSCGASDEPEVVPEAERQSAGLDNFEMPSVSGDVVTQDIFKDAKVTMLNVWATFCSPCISEMPDLQKIDEDYSDKGVQVVGLTSDVFDRNDALMKEIIDKTGVKYTILVPTSDVYNGFLKDISVVPTTFFIDENGKILGQPYTGSRSENDWKAIIDKLLEEVR